MVFSEVLQDVAGRLPGCLGLVVMGMDGIPIDKLTLDSGFNFEMLATESTTILKSTRQASEEVGGGSLRELIVMTETLIVLAQAITDDYVLLGALRKDSPYGRARFVLQQAAMKLEKEFM
jgi:predicted regulator of Ras-like GTPase activity (Roadblock/LC7/MglB family)